MVRGIYVGLPFSRRLGDPGATWQCAMNRHAYATMLADAIFASLLRRVRPLYAVCNPVEQFCQWLRFASVLH